MKEAVKWTLMWVGLALIFCAGIWYFLGVDKASLFLTAYIVEKSLSVDNLFVFIVIFTFFKVDVLYHHKILYWGIIGALITRGLFIGAGITLVNSFHFVMYLFGAFLIYTAYKLAFKDSDDNVNPSENIIIKNIGRIIPINYNYSGSGFFSKKLVNNKYVQCITPLFIVLIAIETTDIMFAFDSIPAVLSITTDPFIVYTSNVFAILGLRSLYFVIAELMPMFRYLKYGLAVVLGFIGLKMLVNSYIEVPTALSLIIVLVTLTISIVISILKKETNNEQSIQTN
jgi:tellurite resistance protein TerC